MKKSILLPAFCMLLSYISSAQSCFSPATDFAAGSNPTSVISADFNGDGKMDLVTGNNSGFNVSILLGNGSGGFLPVTLFPTYSNPNLIICNDFNGDGKMDLAIAENANNVSILLGNGLGGFSAASNFVVGTYPVSLTSADFNGDGKLDLATANYSGNSLSVILGNGSGGFSAATNFALGAVPSSVISADFNGDGKKDLAAATASGNVSVLLGNGSGGFSAATNFAAGAIPYSVLSADFNGDGKMDLATADGNACKVSVMLGNGIGGFSAAIKYPTGANHAHAIIASDLNGDGKLDLATVNRTSYGEVSILHGNGSGGFALSSNLAVGGVAYSVTSADLNGDGKMDLATANDGGSNTLSVLLGYINFSISQTESSCNGSTGTATVAVTCGTFPYTYSWSTSPVQTTAMATGLSAGTYNLTVTDAVNSSKVVSIIIASPTLSASTSATPNTKCSGVCNGTASVTGVNGGASPFAYQWDALAKNQTTDMAYGLCPGNYSVTITDADGCIINAQETIILTSAVDSNVYLTNIAAIDQVHVSPSFAAHYTYNLPSIINANASNPRNFVDPGKKARFKVECTNKKFTGQSIVSGICKVRTNNPYITITDSSSALNNIGWNNKAWSADEFEISIDPNTPPGTNAYIDFVVQESGQNYATRCIAIPITPLVYSQATPSTIDDDNNPDSQGNDNDICEPNEIIEFYPWLDNISTLNAEYVRGQFENLDNHSFINIWNGIPGVGTTVYNSTWWNYLFAKPQPIFATSFNTTPEYDFVFNYNNTNITNDFKLYMVMAGGFHLFSGNVLSLVQWSLPYTFNNTVLPTSIESELKNKADFNFFPNPTNGLVQFPRDHGKIRKITIYNAIGSLIYQSEKETTDLDLSGHPKGVYLIQLQSGDNVFNKKLVMQ